MEKTIASWRYDEEIDIVAVVWTDGQEYEYLIDTILTKESLDFLEQLYVFLLQTLSDLLQLIHTARK